MDLGALGGGLRADNPRLVGTGVAMLAVAQVAAIDVACANALANQRARASDGAGAPIDYSDRRGFAKPPSQMRGAARADFQAPRDFRTPELLERWDLDRPAPLV